MDYQIGSFKIGALAKPRIDVTVFVARTATVLGDVTVGPNASVWFGAVLRGDMGPITIGENTNIQDNAVVHVDFGFPTVIGRNVSVGHSAIIHGASIGDDCIIGMHATILNGARIGAGCIVGAGAIVMQGQEVPPGSIVLGIPAKFKKHADDETRAMIRRNWEIYADFARQYRHSDFHREFE
jgi:carbonic anhydrase/acetyltransferase-like protein (isoleucine patch superfamily)